MFLVHFIIFCHATILSSETVLQKEKITFEKCLEVIELSAVNLGVNPDIKVKTKTEHIAHFVMLDGVLSIRCDKKIDEMVVSSIEKM